MRGHRNRSDQQEDPPPENIDHPEDAEDREGREGLFAGGGEKFGQKLAGFEGDLARFAADDDHVGRVELAGDVQAVEGRVQGVKGGVGVRGF